MQGISLFAWPPPPAPPGVLTECEPPTAFAYINFEPSTLVRSNLGGQGGRCTTEGLCAEAPDALTPHEIYIRNVVPARSADDPIDLRITNQSEYANRARWRASERYGTRPCCACARLWWVHGVALGPLYAGVPTCARTRARAGTAVGTCG